MRYLISMLAVAVLAAPALAQAPGAFGPRQGDWELTLSGGGDADREFDTGSFSINADVNHYFTRNWSAGVRQAWVWAGGSDTPDSYRGATRAQSHFHFDAGQLRPFLGASLGYKYGRAPFRDTGVVAPEGGVRWYVKEETFIYGLIGYDIDFRRAAGQKRGGWSYTFGIGFNF